MTQRGFICASTDVRYNPLVAKADPAKIRAAISRNPAPTLFTAGATPPFTASGIPVDTLLQAPWQARHPLARAGTTAEAYAIMATFEGLGPDEADIAAAVNYGSDIGNTGYAARVDKWLNDGIPDDQLYATLWPNG